MDFLEEENAKKVITEFMKENYRNTNELEKFRKKAAE